MADKDENIEYVEGCPDWMMTMGDAMSLLLTFFVLLLTFSTPDESKLMDVLGSIQGALSLISPMSNEQLAIYKGNRRNATPKGTITDGDKEKSNISPDAISSVKLKSMEIINRYNDFKDRLQFLGFKNVINTQQLDEGIVVTAPFTTLFVPNQVQPELSETGRQFLEKFANLIYDIGNEVRITACFKMESSDEWLKAWAAPRAKVITVGDYMAEAYSKILPERFAFGEKVISGKEDDYIQFMIVEKNCAKEVDLSELIKMRKKEKP